MQDIAVGLEVRWSELLMAPYLAKAEIEIDGEGLAELHSSAQQGRALLTSFNFAHPLLMGSSEPSDSTDFSDESLEGDSAGAWPGSIGDPFSSPLGSEIWELSRELAADQAGNQNAEFRIAVETVLSRVLKDSQRIGKMIHSRSLIRELDDVWKISIGSDCGAAGSP